MNLRAKPQSFALAEPTPFCRTFCYWSDHPLEAMRAEGYFLPFCAQVMAGDRIKAVQSSTPDPRQGRVLAYAELLVVAVDATARTLDLRTLATATFPEVLEGEAEAPEAPERYVASDRAKVAWNVGKRRHEVIEAGAVVGASEKRDEAEAMARGDLPLSLPEMAA